jgi:hypothetical protein
MTRSTQSAAANPSNLARLPRNDAELAARIAPLEPDDRHLLREVLLRAVPLAGVTPPGASVEATERRLVTLLRRISREDYLRTLAALPYLPADQAALARRAVLHGADRAQLANEVGLTADELRARLAHLRETVARCHQAGLANLPRPARRTTPGRSTSAA